MSAVYDIKGRDINDSPASSLTGSTFGSVAFENGAFQLGGLGNHANGNQSASPVGATSAGLGGGGAAQSGGFSLPMLLLLAGGAVLAFYLMKGHAL